PAGQVWLTQRPLLINNIDQLRPYPAVRERILKAGVRSLCMLPLNSAGRRLGVLGFGSIDDAAYNECDVAFLEKVTRQVALAVDNRPTFEQAPPAQREWPAQRARSRFFLEFNTPFVSILDHKHLLKPVPGRLGKTLPHVFPILAFYEEETKS